MKGIGMFRLIIAALLFLPFLAGAATPEKAGMVILSLGKNHAQQPGAVLRPLKRQSDIYNMDTVTTAEKGRLQLRFTDGSRLALGENSQFMIEGYQYSKDKPQNGKSVYKLLEGSLRTITGAISKATPENYQLQTPIATIGVRGTDYIVALCNQNCEAKDQVEQGLYGYVIEGEILITDKSGQESAVIAGRYFHMNNSGQTRISEQPLSAFELMQGLEKENMTLQKIEPNIPAMDIKQGPKLEQLRAPRENGEVNGSVNQ